VSARGPLLDVRDLEVRFPTDVGPVHAVNGVSFSVQAGERIGVVGESGSGKTVTGLSLIGLVRSPPATVSGQILYDGSDVLRLRAKERQRLRGAEIAMIFQNPLSSLNPAMTVGNQIAEAIRAHEDTSKRVAKANAVELLGRVGIPAPARNADEYPHRFSGGMRQRVMIAIALASGPRLLIADEPTTALDVTIQAQILDLLMSLSDEREMAVMLITHDLAVLAGFAERIVVMYAGRVMEEGPVDTIYYRSTHPYTWGLLSSITRLDEPRRDRLSPIAGNPPSALSLPSGCVFHPRCPYGDERSHQEVPALMVHPGDDHACACHYAAQLTPPPAIQEMRR
jgi:oligopeptide/dipeptide ABC transporter ATP-binding protein